MFLKPAVETEELVQRYAREQERNSQTRRINGQKEHSFKHRLLGAGDCQNSSQDWSDARSPAKCEGEAQHQRAQKSTRFLNVVETFVFIEKVDFENTRQVYSENDQDNARNLAQQPHSTQQELPNPCGSSSEENEGDRKSDDEHDGVQQHRSEKRRIFLI